MFTPFRVNKLDMGNHGLGSITFDAGVCDCIIYKCANESGGATGVTCNGQAMQLLGFIEDNAAPNRWLHQVWGLQNAPQGIVTIVPTIFSTTFSSVESYSGIDTTATFPNDSNADEHHFGVGSLDDIQVDVTTTEDDCILVGLGGYQGSGITFMQPGSNTATISRNPPSGGTDLSFESSPLVTGAAGTYHLEGTTGGGSNGICISLVVVALTPGPNAVPTRRGSMFLVFD